MAAVKWATWVGWPLNNDTAVLHFFAALDIWAIYQPQCPSVCVSIRRIVDTERGPGAPMKGTNCFQSTHLCLVPANFSQTSSDHSLADVASILF